MLPAMISSGLSFIAPARRINEGCVRNTRRVLGAKNACCSDLHRCGAAMPILTVRHVTTYHYKQPVAFGEHRMMLRPRDDDDQKVLESELRITPEPSQLTWTQDIFGNHVATARF